MSNKSAQKVKSAADVPVPMMDDDDDLAEEASPAAAASSSAAAVSSSGGYGPIKRKDEGQTDGSVVFRPVEVEDCIVEAMEDDGVGSGDEGAAKGPYVKPDFPALTPKEQGIRNQLRRIPVPPQRFTPLKSAWMSLIQPVVDHMKLQVRMNTRRRAVEIRSSGSTDDIGALQKSADYMKAFMLGFDQSDAVALLRLDDLFIESFEVKDVKRLTGDHLSRCIGRIAGKDGKTKYAIENATRTRISLCEDKIHILGSFSNIKLARDSICSLILGSAPGKVYTKLRTVSKRLQERI